MRPLWLAMVLKKILVGLDGTTRGIHAFRMAGILAHATGAEVLGVTVHTGPVAQASPADPRHRIRQGVPAVEIPRLAESEGADLIVLGRCPLAPSALGRTGTVTEGVLRRARVPVLIVPEASGLERALAVAADDDSAGVVTAARAVTAALRAELHVVQVEPAHAMAGGSWGREAHQVDPAHEILDAVRTERADLLIIGRRRGSTAVDRDAGNVAARVLAQARCAVLVVPQ